MAHRDLPRLLQVNDVHAFIDDEVIMLKSTDRHGDPVELTSQEALRVASWLAAWARRLDGEAVDE